MKNHYIAYSVENDGKYCSSCLKVNSNTNLLGELNIKGILHANIYETKKKAVETSNFWNECYKRNGTYMF